MIRPRMLVAALVMLCGLGSVADAQLFPNAFWNRTRQSSAGCPNGICPTAQVFNRFSASADRNWTNRDGLSPREHVAREHGVNTTGWSDAQVQKYQNDYHNQYGPGHPVKGQYLSSPAPVYQAPRIITSSTITIAPPLPAIAPRPNDVPIAMAEFSELSFVPMAAEPGFRGELRAAINEARKAKVIDVRTAFKLQSLTFSPAFVSAAQNLAVTQMVLSGEDGDKIPRTEDGRVNVAGIPWGELGKFLQLVIPLLLELLKGLGL
jgi:hypothetical protein